MIKRHNYSGAEARKRAISLTLALVLIMLVLPLNNLTASAATYGDLVYSDNGATITITGYTGQPTSIVIPETINGKPVTAIGNSIKTTGPNPGETHYSIAFPFNDCSSLTGITIPGSVTSIGHFAFYGCKNLSSITLSVGLISIGDRAFGECASLSSIAIPNSVTSIGEDTFIGCTGLESITLSNTLFSLGDYAFYRCTNLRSVTVPGSLKNIGVQVFGACSSLSNAVIENGVQSIGLSMFFGCTSLSSIRIPNSVSFIGNYAFYGSSSLYDVFFDSSTPPNVGTQSFGDIKPGARAVVPSGATAYGPVGSNWNGLIVYDVYNPTQPTDFAVQTSVNSNAYGTAGANPSNATQGSTVALNATPFSGYRFVRWEVVSGGITINNQTSPAASFIMPANNVSVRAVFEPSTSYVPVTSISGVSLSATAGTPLTLTGTVNPSNATNKAIDWSLVSAGMTGATINGSTLNATAAGTVTVRATIANGTAVGANYWQDFTIRVSDASLSDPFTMGEDNYRFANTNASFGYVRDYRIPLERYQEIFIPSTAQIYYYYSSLWGGSCYGFAASSYALETYRLRHSDYQSGAATTYSFNTPGSPASAVTKLIELYQISQSLPELWRSLEDPQRYNNLHALVSAVSNETVINEDGLIVCLWGLRGGHAVIAYGIESLGGTRYSIMIYDNNQPENRNLRIEVDTSKSGSAGWAFNSADTQSYNIGLHDDISFINGVVIYSAVENAKRNKSDGSGNGMQFIVPTDTMIVDNRGVDVENISGAYKITPLSVLPLNPDGSDPTPQRTTELWAVPADEYTVAVDGTENLSISVLNDSAAYSINVLPTDDRITVDIGDVVAIEGAVHGNITEYLDDGTELMIPIVAASDVDLAPGGDMEIAEFSDVSSGAWYNSAVTSVATVGIVEGVGNRRFDPQGTLTVAQLVTMLMRTQYGRMSGGSQWYSAYIGQAEKDGILLASDNLEPGKSITRAQAALLITRFIELNNPRWVKDRVSNTPTDMANVPNGYRAAVEKAYAWGIINGDDNNKFNPQGTLTRAEAAQILYNYYSIVD